MLACSSSAEVDWPVQDPDLHLKHLKQSPPTHEIVDNCIECGFCESNCPSKDVTLTPRQRITTLREISRMKGLGSLTPGQQARCAQHTQHKQLSAVLQACWLHCCILPAPCVVQLGICKANMVQPCLPLQAAVYDISRSASYRQPDVIAHVLRLDELEEVYKYQGAETCAADGMCQVKCPVKINTGEMIKHLRAEKYDDGTPSKYAQVCNADGAALHHAGP